RQPFADHRDSAKVQVEARSRSAEHRGLVGPEAKAPTRDSGCATYSSIRNYSHGPEAGELCCDPAARCQSSLRTKKFARDAELSRRSTAGVAHLQQCDGISWASSRHRS